MPGTEVAVVPSEYPELSGRPALSEMMRRQIDMQFVDLATLLQLPLAGSSLTAGANLTTTTLLCNIVSGASVLFFEPSLDAVRGRLSDTNTLRSGARFRGVLDRYFPWADSGSVPQPQAIRALYKYARNPLAHSLGVGKAPALLPGLAGPNVMLAKRPLPAHAAAEVLRGEPSRPFSSDVPIFETDYQGYVISVEGLSWGVCRMPEPVRRSRPRRTGRTGSATAARRRRHLGESWTLPISRFTATRATTTVSRSRRGVGESFDYRSRKEALVADRSSSAGPGPRRRRRGDAGPNPSFEPSRAAVSWRSSVRIVAPEGTHGRRSQPHLAAGSGCSHRERPHFEPFISCSGFTSSRGRYGVRPSGCRRGRLPEGRNGSHPATDARSRRPLNRASQARL